MGDVERWETLWKRCRENRWERLWKQVIGPFLRWAESAVLPPYRRRVHCRMRVYTSHDELDTHTTPTLKSRTRIRHPLWRVRHAYDTHSEESVLPSWLVNLQSILYIGSSSVGPSWYIFLCTQRTNIHFVHMYNFLTSCNTNLKHISFTFFPLS